MEETQDVRSTMEKLELLDLSKCNTVGELVAAMSKCSFGARMLGEAADTLTRWAQSKPKPACFYNGLPGTAFSIFLREMVRRGFFSGVWTSLAKDLERQIDEIRAPAVFVGPYPEMRAPFLTRPGRIMFVNHYGQVPPGTVRDGHFPNVVFADPNFVMPVLDCVLRERIFGEKTRVAEFVKMYDLYGGLASDVAHGAETLQRMVDDPDCTVFMTLSGAMTIAKMQLLVCDMIDLGMVSHVASTGALMAHGLVEGIGLSHYKYDPRHSDALLAEQKLNRVTDTLEPEENFDHVDEVVSRVLARFDGSRPVGSVEFHRAIGEHLVRDFPNNRAILASAYRKGVPVSVPAFADSEIGNDVFVEIERRTRVGKSRLVFDPAHDTEVLLKTAVGAKRMGIFSVGGGVPRNNTQNVAPLIEILNSRLDLGLPVRQFFYGCRIDPAPLWYGNLSGCTYSEGGSWRKMDFSGRFSEIRADATIVWPFLLKYVMEKRSR